MKNSKMWTTKRGRGEGRNRSFLIGLLTAAGILIAAITMTALLISQNKLGIKQSGIAAKLFYALSVFAGCFLTARKAERRKLLVAAIAAAVLCIWTVGIAFAFPGAGAISTGPLFGITAIAWLAGSFFGAKKKRSRYV
ncbi:MAG: YrzE family protein [Oscillospiraceae bacterium]|nr:YrzE family protein [Oscillospiraceae bacterium]